MKRTSIPGGFDLQGHRGARGLLPENTIPSFQRAIEIGVRTIELDVVISQDGLVVVSHDPTMSSAICSHPDGTPVLDDEAERLILYAMPYETIRTFDCGLRGNPSFRTQQPMPAYKPLLSDVVTVGEDFSLTASQGPIRYNIELKSSPSGDGIFHPEPESFARIVLNVVLQNGIENRSTIQSFDPRILQVLNAMSAEVDLALLVGQSEDRGLEQNIGLLGFTPKIYSPDFRLVNADLVLRVHDMNMRLVPWTVNDAEDMSRLISLGVDGLITDYPDIAVQELGSVLETGM